MCSVWCCSLARLSRMQYTTDLWKYWKPLGLRAPWCCTKMENMRTESASWTHAAQMHSCSALWQMHKTARFSSFLCRVILGDKEILNPWLQTPYSGAKLERNSVSKADLSRPWEVRVLPLWHELGYGAAGSRVTVSGGTGVISFPESLAPQRSNSQVSAPACKRGQHLCSSQSPTADTGKAAFISSK